MVPRQRATNEWLSGGGSMPLEHDPALERLPGGPVVPLWHRLDNKGVPIGQMVPW